MSGIYWWDLMQTDAADAAKRDSGKRALTPFETNAENTASAILSELDRGRNAVGVDQWRKVKPRDIPGATAYGLRYKNLRIIIERDANIFSEGCGVSMTVRDEHGRETGFYRGAKKGPVAELGKRVLEGVTSPDRKPVEASVRELVT